MPKKTKKAKMRAERRRGINIQASPASPSHTSNTPTPPPAQLSSTYAFQFAGKTSIQPEKIQSANPHLAKNVVKTVILASIAITSEVVLSLVVK